MKKALPIGIENFRDMVWKDCYYIDKTAFIKPLMEAGNKVLLLTRPRRFGKTLFMDTLKSFLQLDFQKGINGERNALLFKGLRIAQDRDFCSRHMGRYPVISMTLKDVEGGDFESAYVQFAENLEDTLDPYRFLMDSPKLSPRDKDTLRQYLTTGYLKDSAHVADCKNFLKNLAAWLSKHYDRQVVILIDEYDVPLAKAAQFGYYDKMLELVRAFLGQALKEKPQAQSDAPAYLMKAVLTGCLRVSKESIFTGINNPLINTVCSEDRSLSEIIGFTADEVRSFLDYYGLSNRYDDVKCWYDGYRFYESEIYCPWDVINFAYYARESGNDGYEPENYWDKTSDSSVIREFLGFLNEDDAERMQRLVDGESVELEINDKLTYSDFKEHDPTDFWTLLLYSGYLTAISRVKGVLNTYRVRIPNEEIRDTFEKNVRSLYSKKNKQYAGYGEKLAVALLSGQADGVRRVLLPLLRRYVSVRDEATKAPPENYYHGFLSAMLICAGSTAANLRSSPEAGLGIADLVFTSEDLETGIVIEVKRCHKPEEMPKAAREAIKQIKEKRYVQVFDGYECRRCFGYGIAFCKKLCVVSVEELAPEQ